MKFRDFKKNDISNILDIYNYHILNGLGNFEENPATYKEFSMMCSTIINLELPFMICEKENEILGFAFLNKFRNKSGYKFSFENSIYLNKNFIGKGLGSLLLKELIIKSSQNSNIKTIVAVIGGNNVNASIRIHEKNGFKIVGKLKKIGFKNNQWLDSTYMQLSINE